MTTIVALEFDARKVNKPLTAFLSLSGTGDWNEDGDVTRAGTEEVLQNDAEKPQALV